MADERTELKLGQRLTVVVEKVLPWGVFVRITPHIRGLIRRRELTLSGDTDPAARVAPGQEIEAVVTALAQSGRVCELSHIQTLPDPWLDVARRFRSGEVVAATVKNSRANGTYVELAPGVSGFIPQADIIDLSHGEPEFPLWASDHIEAVITRIDKANRLIYLSMRQRFQRRVEAQQVLDFLDQRYQQEVSEPSPASQPTFDLLKSLGNGERVIVVEDGDDLREQLITWLNHQGFQAEGTATLAGARRLLASPTWLALIDIDLAGDNGLQLGLEINTQQPETFVVVMSTPDWLDQESARLARLHVAAVLAKPVVLEEVEQVLEDLVRGVLHMVPTAKIGPAPAIASSPGASLTTSRSLALEDVLAVRLTNLVSATKAELGIVFRIDPVSQTVTILARNGVLTVNEAVLQDLLISPVKDVIHERIAVHDNHASVVWDKYRKLEALVAFDSCIGIPLEAWGEVNHALFLFHRQPDAFNIYRVRDAQAVANLCAAAIERDMLDTRLHATAGLLLSGQLAAVLGHEISNRMSGLEFGLQNLLTDCGQLQSEVQDLAQSKQYVTLHRELESLISAHDDLKRTVISFQQLMRAGDVGQVDLNAILRAAETLVVPFARRHSIRIVADLGANLPVVRGNAIRVQQVFLNLMLNAIQQMTLNPQLGKVLELETVLEHGGAEADAIVTRITDHGPGIHRALWEKVFELGFTTRQGGSGLGLYIARTLVESMGGTIYVAQSLMCLGTTFAVCLPVAPAKEDLG